MKPLDAPVSVSATPAPAPVALPVAAPDNRFRQVRLGLCDDYPVATHALSHVAKDLDLLQQMGATVLRHSVAWIDLEPQPGVYRFEHLDAIVALAEARGITLLPYIGYTPAWAARPGKQCWVQPPADVEAFGRFCGVLADRYRGRIGAWEVWNEADNTEFFSGNQADYAAMLKAASRAIRAADPTAQVVLAGIAWNTAWLNGLFRDHGVSDHVDAVNIHSYHETWLDQPVEMIVDYVGRAADTIARYGNNQPLRMVELGYSDHRQGAFVSSVCHAYYAYEHTTEFQAVQLVRTLALLLSTPHLDTIGWYEVRDLPLDAGRIGDVNNCFLGLARPDGTPKPAMAAFSLMNRFLGGRHRCIDSELRITRSGDSAAQVHAFELEDGRVIAFAWLRTSLPGHRPQRDWGEIADTRQETIDIHLPRAIRGSATTCDAIGQTRHRAHLEGQGDTTCLRIPLRGGDVVILEITPD